MNIQRFFFIAIMDFHLVAEATLSGDFPSQAVESREKLTGLDTGIDLEVNFIPFLKFLEVLA
jgi:hypothetical protein